MTLLQLLFAIFAVSSISAVYCRTIDNEDKSELDLCERNPHLWCTNFTTAVKCNAVRYCIDTVWKEARLDLDDDNTCSSCVNEIISIRNGINSNVTKDVLKTALEYVCETNIFTRILRKQCIQLVDFYVDANLNELLDLIHSDIDPQTICKILLLCSKPEVSEETISAEDDVVVDFDNVILHFPAHDMQFINPIPITIPKKVGVNRCTWGPSYWCNNLTTSKECSSTSHCIKSLWSNQHYEEDGDSVCKVCKDMVKQARDQLLSNETQEELKEVLEGSCKLIPIKLIDKECIQLADEFIPELTEMLASQMNPNAVCTVAGLCNSQRIDELLEAESKKTQVNDLSTVNSCVNCTVAFISMKNFVQSTSKENVLDRVLNICSELSSYSDLCVSVISNNFDEVYNLMNNQLQPFAACHLSGMCALKYHIHPQPEDVDFEKQVDTMLAVKNDDLPCDLCKQLVHHFQEVLVANTTEEEFQQILQGFCEQTGKFKSECLELVNGNFKIIYTFLTEELDPVRICAEIQICPRPANFVSDANLNLIAQRVVPVMKDDVQLSNLWPVVPSEVGDTSCRFCKTIVSVIQSELKKPEYEKNVLKVLDKVCSIVPRGEANECREFINTYSDILIGMLTDDTDPRIVCEYLKLCPDYTKSKSHELCPLCQYLMHFIQESLEDPKDEDEIKKAVGKVCNLVPDAEKNKCHEFISQYSSLIVSILAQEVDPSLVCPAIKLCPSASPANERCKHCRIFYRDIASHLKNNYKYDNVKQKMDSLIPVGDGFEEYPSMNQLRTYYQQKLDSLKPVEGLEKSATVAELKTFHRQDIIDMMSAEFDDEEACLFLKFCDADSAHTPIVLEEKEKENNDIVDIASQEGASCEICEMFVTIYEKKLISNRTEDEVEGLMKSLCDKLSRDKELQNNCNEMVDKYVPVIFNLLKKDVSPKELCAAAQLCSLRSVHGGSEAECRTCEVVVGSMESVLADPFVKNYEFEHARELCEQLSGRKRTVCFQLVTELFPEIEGLVFDIPAWYVCSKMRMCPYTNRMNEEACSNAEMWCQDKKTAFMCDRLEYCKKNVWKISA